ncbi:hypothetical protein [Maricaulis sp.]|uniref:hypothetical protein n=1 Tax=Maricaulis sp. TaxID=1486257 RepID=UPI0025C1F5EA|nr:hypothetical protein [Maricaulis sp.]
MILARITRALKDQNWFAVALEFIIVIAGVVIGFQVTAWNDGRSERVIIAGQLREVREDIRADLIALEETRQASLWRMRAAEYLLLSIENEGELRRIPAVPWGDGLDRSILPVVSEADHSSLLARVNLIRGVTGRSTGYDSLVNSGNIRLIETDALRTTIQRYYAGYEDFESNLSIFRDIRAAAIPILYRHGFSLFSEQDLASVIEAAENDPAFIAYLRTGRELGLGQIGGVLEREAEARALLALVDAELAP